MSTPRRKFLSWLGASSVLAASTSVLASGRMGAQVATPVSDKWDMSWTDRVTGKYKGVFDSPETAEGTGLLRACIWRDQHKEVYGTPLSDTSSVLVVRHEAMALVMNDEFWKRFHMGKEEKMTDPDTKHPYEKNPIRIAEANASGPRARYNMTDFVADGGVVLGCGLAFRMVVGMFQKADKLSPAEANKVAREHLLPGVILQPSGIFAVLRAQEIGCNYVLAS